MRSCGDDAIEVCQVYGETLGEAPRARPMRITRPPAIPAAVARSLAEDVIRRLVKHGPGGMAGTGSPVGRRSPAPAPAAATAGADRGDIERLCDALVSDDPMLAAELIEGARLDGRTPEILYLGYVAEAARRLGERWVEDTASFLDVTLGLSRLHAILRQLGPAFFATRETEVPGRTAMFAAVPGETHVLGVVMAADFFRRRGWQVELHTAPGFDALNAAAGRREVAVIGLSASSRRMIAPLAETVLRLRAVAGSTPIVVGGRLTELEPGIADAVGADGIAGDAATAAVSLQPGS